MATRRICASWMYSVIRVNCKSMHRKDKIMVKPFQLASSSCPGLYDTLLELSDVSLRPKLPVWLILGLLSCLASSGMP